MSKHKQLATANQFTAIEDTPVGPQYLIEGIKLVSLREKLEYLASMPVRSKRTRAQKPCDIGLFDETARNQLELFQ